MDQVAELRIVASRVGDDRDLAQVADRRIRPQFVGLTSQITGVRVRKLRRTVRSVAGSTMMHSVSGIRSQLFHGAGVSAPGPRRIERPRNAGPASTLQMSPPLLRRPPSSTATLLTTCLSARGDGLTDWSPSILTSCTTGVSQLRRKGRVHEITNPGIVSLTCRIRRCSSGPSKCGGSRR